MPVGYNTPMEKPALPENSPVCATVYSVVWPSTEALVRRVFSEQVEQMLDAHRSAFTKRQDGLHEPFFSAWLDFSQLAVRLPRASLCEHYPTAGSSEAIREIIRQASWKQQDLVVFEGEYEGYEAMAAMQGTRVHVVDRARWHETLEQWRQHGVPWQGRTAQWWVSQPSAIDGNLWKDFQAWLSQMDEWEANCEVWVDLTYVGRARQQAPIDLSSSACLAGIVFSLSKVMGAYYRRIGGCMSKQAIPGLWGNRWFKNLDSLYLGQRWIEYAGDAMSEGQRYADVQSQAMQQALLAMGGEAWSDAGVNWSPSDVPLLMHATGPLSVPGPLRAYWLAARRGKTPASHRLCLTPMIESLLGEVK